LELGTKENSMVKEYTSMQKEKRDTENGNTAKE
jgi:hypothetical protein